MLNLPSSLLQILCYLLSILPYLSKKKHTNSFKKTLRNVISLTNSRFCNDQFKLLNKAQLKAPSCQLYYVLYFQPAQKNAFRISQIESKCHSFLLDSRHTVPCNCKPFVSLFCNPSVLHSNCYLKKRKNPLSYIAEQSIRDSVV